MYEVSMCKFSSGVLDHRGVLTLFTAGFPWIVAMAPDRVIRLENLHGQFTDAFIFLAWARDQ